MPKSCDCATVSAVSTTLCMIQGTLSGFGPKRSRTDPLRERLRNESRHDAAAICEGFIICVQLNGRILATVKKKVTCYVAAVVDTWILLAVSQEVFMHQWHIALHAFKIKFLICIYYIEIWTQLFHCHLIQPFLWTGTVQTKEDMKLVVVWAQARFNNSTELFWNHNNNII